MKICLYLEFYHFLGGFLYKKIGTGLLSSYKNQKKILDKLGVEYTEAWDDTADILQINTPWFFSLFLIKKAKRQHKKIIIWSHVTAEDIKGVFRLSFLISPLAKRYLTYAYGLADVIFSPSEYTKTLLIAYGISADKIVVMSNGVDVEKYAFDLEKREVARQKNNITGLAVGTVGLAIPRKGISTFVSAARAFPESSFVWFGKIYSSLIAPAVPTNIPKNMQFTGYVTDIIGAYAALDIFLFPSYEENEGMSILEAGSIGLPIVVRDIPVYGGWLVHGENCLKARTDEEFNLHIHNLLGDEDLRKKLGANARALAQSRSLDAMATKTQHVYDTLIQ